MGAFEDLIKVASKNKSKESYKESLVQEPVIQGDTGEQLQQGRESLGEAIINPVVKALDTSASIPRAGVNAILAGEEPITSVVKQIGNIAGKGIEAGGDIPQTSEQLQSRGWVENPMLAEAIGLGIDVATPMPSAFLKPLSKLGKAGSKLADVMPDNAVAKTLKKLSEPKQVLKGIEEAGAGDVLAKEIKNKDFEAGIKDHVILGKQIVKEKLTPYLNDLEKMKEIISPSEVKNVGTPKYNINIRSKSGGLLNEAGEDLGRFIKEAHSQLGEASGKYSPFKTYAKLGFKKAGIGLSPVSGATPNLNAYLSELDKILKPTVTLERESLANLPPEKIKIPMVPDIKTKYEKVGEKILPKYKTENVTIPKVPNLVTKTELPHDVYARKYKPVFTDKSKDPYFNDILNTWGTGEPAIATRTPFKQTEVNLNEGLTDQVRETIPLETSAFDRKGNKLDRLVTREYDANAGKFVDEELPPPVVKIIEEYTAARAPHNLPDIMKLKQNIGAMLGDKDFKKLVKSSPDAKSKKDILVEVNRALDKEVESALEGKKIKWGGEEVDAKLVYEHLNSRYSSLSKISDLLNTQEIKGARDTSGLAKAIGAVLGGGAGAGIGIGASAMGLPVSPAIPMIVGGMYGASRGVSKNIEKAVPAIQAKGASMLQDVGNIEGKGIMGTAKGLGEQSVLESIPENVTREVLPNAPQPEMKQEQPKQNILKDKINSQIIRNPLPRTTKEWMDNQSWITKKFAFMHPEMLGPLQAAFQDPSGLEEFVMAWTKMASPEFVKDKFNRVNGKLQDPQSEELAAKKIMDDPTMTNTQKALMVDNMRKTKELKGYNV